MMSEKEKILEALEPFFQVAIKEKKWFRSKYQNILFSPKELRQEHKRGNFIWGPINWELVDPPKLKDVDEENMKIRKYNGELQTRIIFGWEI